MLLFSAFTYWDVFVPSATFSQTITVVTSRVKKNKKVSLNQNATSAGQLDHLSRSVSCTKMCAQSYIQTLNCGDFKGRV